MSATKGDGEEWNRVLSLHLDHYVKEQRVKPMKSILSMIGPQVPSFQNYIIANTLNPLPVSHSAREELDCSY